MSTKNRSLFLIGTIAVLLIVTVGTMALLIPRVLRAGARLVHASPEPLRWTYYVNGDGINDLAVEGSLLWAATDGGGVVAWNLATGAYEQYLITDGLENNHVYAAMVDRQGDKWLDRKSVV